MSDRTPERHPRYGEIEEYAQGEIRSYRGIVNKWLLLVYAVLAIWGLVKRQVLFDVIPR